MHDDSSDNLLTNEVSVNINCQQLSLLIILTFSVILAEYYVQIFHVPDLNLEQTGLAVLLDVYVDWEMGVDVSHLVFESLGDTNDQVVNQGSDCAEGSDILAGTVVKLDIDNFLLWVGEVDCQMAEILGERSYAPVSPPFAQLLFESIRTSWTLDCDLSRLDGDLD